MTLRFAALPGVSLIAAALALGAVLVAPAAQAQDKTPAMDPQQRGAIETVVREYLLANPEVIVDAIRLYREREQQAQADQAKMAL